MLDSAMQYLDQLEVLRNAGGQARTTGLPDDVIKQFIDLDPSLGLAIEGAVEAFGEIRNEFPSLIAAHELEQIKTIQDHFINFYAKDAINPYVSLAARGPWIVTLKGAVIHDSGGYGMLGMGHAPFNVLAAMDGNQVMANVMTANVSQLRLGNAIHAEIGHTRGGCPFAKFLCLNSGSESVTLAARLSDINAKKMTDEGGRHAGKPIKIMSLAGGFHGRTDRPAQYSDSSRRSYRKNMASFRDRDNLITVRPNDLTHLRQRFADAESNGYFIESLFIEPVMGEGNPGAGLNPDFYALAHELITAHGGLLLVDSIQAGLRAHGVLSIVDYPGFKDLPAPHMETYSKALNAGQYPLSVLAIDQERAELYQQGAYGNTMTTNPRAMDVACTVLRDLTPELRQNIVDRGAEFVTKLEALANEMGGPIRSVQGTGLLFSAELDPTYKCYGADSTEEYLRTKGIGVIHGGENSLRFTPHFAITSAEVEMIVNAVKTRSLMVLAAKILPIKLRPPARRTIGASVTLRRADLRTLLIVIVNYRSWNPLSRCLESLGCAPAGPDVVVIDNDSNDGQLELFEAQFPHVTFIKNVGNLGFASGCNLGARNAEAEHVLFLNPDAQVSQAVLQQWLDHHRYHGPGISTIEQLTSSGKSNKVFGAFPSVVNAFGWSRAIARLCAKRRPIGEDCMNVDWITGAALLIDRSQFDHLGGFDEDYWMYYEDVDLCRRATDASIEIRYCPIASMIHDHGGASRNDTQTALSTRTEVVVSRHLYVQKHSAGMSRIFLHFTTVLSRLILAAPLALLSARRRKRIAALMRYYRSALQAGRWKVHRHQPEISL